MPENEFKENGRRFSEIIEKKLEAPVFEEMKSRQHAGEKVLIVSASLEEWIRPWAESNGVDAVIATKPEYIANSAGVKVLSGSFEGSNCIGEEKVRRLEKLVGNRQDVRLSAWSDSKSDAPLLEYADEAHWVSKRHDTAFALGTGLLVMLAAFLIISSIAYWLRLEYPVFTFMAGLMLGLFFAWRLGSVRSAAFLLAATIIVTLFAIALFDGSYDSLHYHHWTIHFLAEGWNPFLSPCPVDNIWIRHYARAEESMSAPIVALTGLLTAGKAVNMLYFISSFCIVKSLLRSICSKLSDFQIWLLSFVFMLNPVLIAQMMSSYNDAFLYVELIVASLCMIYLASPRTQTTYRKYVWLILILTTIIAINSKFTHFFYIGLLWVIFVTINIINGKRNFAAKSVFVGFISLAVALLIVGYNPYITNIIETGDPFYPLLSGKVDIMTQNTPEILQDDNRFLATLKANLSTPDKEWQMLRNPFDVNLYTSTSVDARILGFGPFFFILFLLSLVLMAVSRPGCKIWALYTVVFVSCFIFQQSWWARYVPMMWATIGISVYASMMSDKHKSVRYIVYILIGLNSILTAARTLSPQVVNMAKIIRLKEKSTIEPVALDTLDADIMKIHLRQYGIHLQEPAVIANVDE